MLHEQIKCCVWTKEDLTLDKEHYYCFHAKNYENNFEAIMETGKNFIQNLHLVRSELMEQIKSTL